MPAGGLFAGQEWRISPTPFRLGAEMAKDLEKLGRVLLQFNKAVNRLYRLSVEGKQPAWVARWLDLGKPAELIAGQRSAAMKNEWPRVIRPDLLITESGLHMTELDSVPGGIGLTAWLNQTYAQLGFNVLGGADGMLRGFASIFGDAPQAHIVISEESATYRPEMAWVAGQLGGRTLQSPRRGFHRFCGRRRRVSLLRVIRRAQRAERTAAVRARAGKTDPPDAAAQADI